MTMDPGDGWETSGRLSVRTLDVLTDVAVEDDVLRSTMSRLLAATSVQVPEDPSRGTISVRGHGPFEVREGDDRIVVARREAAVGHGLAALNLRATSRTPLLACHSAVLALGGVGLVVPAASGAGKSTLTAALVKQGWAYGSDEALGLTWDTGATVTYPRPFSLSAWSAEATGTQGGVQGVDETYHLPGVRVNSGVPVGHVVLLERGGVVPELRPVHRATALVELVRRSFTLHQDPGRALLLYADLLRSASCWQLTLGEPRAAAELLTRRLGRG